MGKKIIMITGYKQSGKDTFADICTGFTKIGLSDELKEQAEKVIELIFKDIKGIIKYDWESEYFKASTIPSIYNYLNKRTGKKMTFRDFLEDYGTGLIRTNVYQKYFSTVTRKNIEKSDKEYYVIKDTRFVDEYLAFKDQDDWEVILVYIDRGYKCANPLTESEIVELRKMADIEIDSKCCTKKYIQNCHNAFNDVIEMFN